MRSRRFDCLALHRSGGAVSSRSVKGLDRLRLLVARGVPFVRKAGQLRWRAARVRRLAAVLRPAPRLLLGEVRGGTGCYSLPSGHVIVVRHRTRDLEVVAEVLIAPHAYEPPPVIASRLGGALRILDLGANIGTFGVFALSRWNVDRMRSFEPDPANAAMLNDTIALNRANHCWRAHQAAVSNSPGRMTFISGHFYLSRRADQDEAGIDVMMVDLFTLEYDTDLLKMDIEGGEWSILSDPRMADLQARVIVMEWHWRFAPRADAHAAALDLLARAGYEVHADQIEPRTGTGLVWASRP
jgi:FkbM family methyltransferase